ncbi:MAG TPA: DUF6152 family protein [Vicinamibacterales bacterium]|jgi:hypothetical protein
MKRRTRNVLVAAALAAAAVPAWSHHAAQTMFDVTRRITVTGVVTRVESVNPHPYVDIDVKGPNGSLQHWVIELAGPSVLRQASSSPGGLKPGDVVTVEGIPAKDGTPIAFAYTLRTGSQPLVPASDLSRAR